MEIRHAQVPMGKMGDAWDVANATLFLVSERGAVYHRSGIDRGWWHNIFDGEDMI
jgi:NAD(P)-dependent dehydrogenase (short-subunit alcohol dehydrogenase family)